MDPAIINTKDIHTLVTKKQVNSFLTVTFDRKLYNSEDNTALIKIPTPVPKNPKLT